jgi:hypothetical protein
MPTHSQPTGLAAKGVFGLLCGFERSCVHRGFPMWNRGFHLKLYQQHDELFVLMRSQQAGTDSVPTTTSLQEINNAQIHCLRYLHGRRCYDDLSRHKSVTFARRLSCGAIAIPYATALNFAFPRTCRYSRCRNLRLRAFCVFAHNHHCAVANERTRRDTAGQIAAIGIHPWDLRIPSVCNRAFNQHGRYEIRKFYPTGPNI